MKKISPLIFGLSIFAIISILFIVGVFSKNILSSKDKFQDKSRPDSDEILQNIATISSKKTKVITDPASEGMVGLIDSAIQKSSSEEVQQDVGTGFVIDIDGQEELLNVSDEYKSTKNSSLVVTNKHVVFDTEVSYLVFDNEGREYQVSRIYRDLDNDLAILQVDGFHSDGLPLGDSDKISLGDSVSSVSKVSGELDYSIISGVISGVDKSIEAIGKNKVGSGVVGIDSVAMEMISDAIQTDIEINPGDSGGPLLNIKGQVIGINVAIGEEDGMSFAIPINRL